MSGIFRLNVESFEHERRSEGEATQILVPVVHERFRRGDDRRARIRATPTQSVSKARTTGLGLEREGELLRSMHACGEEKTQASAKASREQHRLLVERQTEGPTVESNPTLTHSPRLPLHESVVSTTTHSSPAPAISSRVCLSVCPPLPFLLRSKGREKTAGFPRSGQRASHVLR